jgi:hypothetical protein
VIAGTHLAFASALYLGGAALFEYPPDPVSWGLAGATSLLPDIDLPTSRLGRTLFWASTLLERRFGHRTLTHSALALATVALLAAPLLLFKPLWFWSVVGGYWSHLWADMLNPRGTDLYAGPLPHAKYARAGTAPTGRRHTSGAASLRRTSPNRLAVGMEPPPGVLALRCQPPSPSLVPARGRWAPAPRASDGGRSGAVPWPALGAPGLTAVGRRSESHRSRPARSCASPRRDPFTEKPPPASQPRLWRAASGASSPRWTKARRTHRRPWAIRSEVSPTAS